LAEFLKIIFGKAGFTACFFLLFCSSSYGTDNIWSFDANLQKAHNFILNLQTDQAYAILRDPSLKANEFHKFYLISFCETVDILITEDEKRFAAVETNFKDRLTLLDSYSDSPEKLFLQAELNLQRGFNYLNLGQELNAVLSIRRAYNFTQDCLKKYPGFVPIKKTSGVIQVMVGSVPDKYHWFMSLLGMKGSVTVGQSQLEQLRNSKSSLSLEATILYYTIKGFINQQFDEASKGIEESLKTDPDNRLLLFLGVNMLVKNSQGADALKLILDLDQHQDGLQMYYIEYLRGETLMYKGDYSSAIQAYQKFIVNYRSLSFKKDSYYKISLCYWLLNKPDLARQNFEKAKKAGRAVAEPDRYAERQLEEAKFPNPKILKVRFFTDGGYYPEAREVLQSIYPSDLATLKDRTEYYYRKARLAHKTGEISAAKLFYSQTIDMTGDNPWYFAANSALQLGYIAQAQKDKTLAKKYFEKALSYKRHEYKNSIDSKAKSALEQLKN
jgi:tetratricopeptide (TPR) repeat protein